jgi:hypothetical protein
MKFSAAAARRFPHPTWAWPKGGLDLLLCAALSPDAGRAMSAARAWFASHDIDAAEFREHRLLLAIAARFGTAMSDLPEYPRLAGLQRMLWTKARMALREAQPPLRDMVAAGVPVMALKGAARLAINAAEQKARVSHDTDILVPPAHFAQALEILTRHGWRASTGESGLCLAARLDSTRAINLFHGHFGDIDLHQWAWPACADKELEIDLWARAVPGDFFGVPLLVPAPEDRITLSLASSALDAHSHSDWLVDCARTLVEPGLDPDRLLAVLAKARQMTQAQTAFSYLRDHIGLTVPVMPALEPAARRDGALHRMGIVLQMKPRGDWTPVSKIARGVAKQMRRLADTRDRVRIPALHGRFGSGHMLAGPQQLSAPLGDIRAGRYTVDITIAIDLPGLRRRIELELNTDNTHLIRLRARDIWPRKGRHILRFRGQVDVPEQTIVWLEARPSKTVRGGDPAEHIRYDALPFCLISATLVPVVA